MKIVTFGKKLASILWLTATFIPRSVADANRDRLGREFLVQELKLDAEFLEAQGLDYRGCKPGHCW